MYKIIFVLIFWMGGTYHEGFGTVEFITEQECETAKMMMKKENGFGILHAVCVEKTI